MKKLLLTMLATLFALSVQADLLAIDHVDYVKKVKNVESKVVANSYKSALKAAKAEQKKAQKLGFEWNTIGGKKGLLTKAAKLHKKGNDKDALKLLSEARKHGILGQQQARDQANAGPTRF